MRFPVCVTLLVSSLVSLFAATSAVAQDQRPAASPSMLSGGDSVRIMVWQKPDMSGDFVVAPDGTITHPLYRAVRVGGVPFATAENNVRTFLKGYLESPQFVLEPLIRVAVSGEVNRPQVFALRPETSIGEAVARAGGTNQFAARNRIRVLRLEPTGQQQEIFVNLSDPHRMEGLMPVRSGDQIVVDRRRSLVKDFILPTLGIIGSIASIALLIDRTSTNR